MPRPLPEPVELTENKGYSLLQPGAQFASLQSVPTIVGQTADLSRYPSRQGYEDLVMLVSDPALRYAWTAVTFPEERYVWFALKDPRVLRHTILWLSNGGRHYAPWSGRHLGVLGLEEVTSYFHYGLAESANTNPLSRRGYDTCVQLQSGETLDIRYIMGIAEIPGDFDQVQSIDALPDGSGVALIANSGSSVVAPMGIAFLDAA